MEAGQSPPLFWEQTPRTYRAIMVGSARRERREQERVVEIAWHVQNFSRAGKKFKNLEDYLKPAKPAKAQTPEDVIALFEGFARRGLATIKV